MRRLVYILLAAQFALFVYLLALTASPTGYITAQGGHITQVQTQPVTQWTGIYGNLATTGSVSVTLAQQEVQRQHIYFDNPQNECKKTELFAAVTPVSAQDITLITPQQADVILGNDPQHAYSITQMYTTQETYALAETSVALWSTTTHGQLTSFTQGIGQVNGTLVFVTKTVRNGRAYNNEPAEYQLLLPAGNWHITYDETDECTLLDEYETTTTTQTTQTLDVSTQTRVCVQQETAFAAVYRNERTSCQPHEWGSTGCEIAEGAELTVRKDTETITATTQSGIAQFTPTQQGEYVLRATHENQTATRLINVNYCLQAGVQDVPEQTIQLTRPEVELGIFPESPREEEPADTQEKVTAAYSLMTTLTITLIIFSLFTFFHVHKETATILLKIRIWLLERRK